MNEGFTHNIDEVPLRSTQKERLCARGDEIVRIALKLLHSAYFCQFCTTSMLKE